jgi:hypothetical protein
MRTSTTPSKTLGHFSAYALIASSTIGLVHSDAETDEVSGICSSSVRVELAYFRYCRVNSRCGELALIHPNVRVRRSELTTPLICVYCPHGVHSSAAHEKLLLYPNELVFYLRLFPLKYTRDVMDSQVTLQVQYVRCTYHTFTERYKGGEKSIEFQIQEAFSRSSSSSYKFK